jgi:hypothetical protein
VISVSDVRAAALAVAGAVELDHHGSPSFRVAGRIFATLPDPEHLHVMVDEGAIHEAVAEHPAACAEKWWGKRLAAVRVTLDQADPEQVVDLLREAWAGKGGRDPDQ